MRNAMLTLGLFLGVVAGAGGRSQAQPSATPFRADVEKLARQNILRP